MLLADVTRYCPICTLKLRRIGRMKGDRRKYVTVWSCDECKMGGPMRRFRSMARMFKGRLHEYRGPST